MLASLREDQMDLEQQDMAYALGHTDHELERLILQARLYEPFTE
jgi:hypothetical protein